MGLLRSELGIILLGAGFGAAFLYAAAAAIIQFSLIKIRKSRIICRMPELPFNSSDNPEFGFEIDRGFPVLPGCSVKTGLEFSWHERSVSASSEYRSASRHGSVQFSNLMRGVYSSPGMCFLVADAAGFFRFRHQAGSGGEMVVKPLAEFNDELPRVLGSGGDNPSRIIRKKRSDELTESRQYYPGDDVRRINWRTYAHTGQLFIRLGEELPNPESHLLIVADLSGAKSAPLSPEQLNKYLDYIVDNLAGLIKILEDKGINVECIFPPGTPADDDRDRLMSGLWWDDSMPPSRLPGKRKHGSCLLICPAFSRNSGSLCRAAADAGMSVSVIVPIPVYGRKIEQTGFIRRILFKSGAENDNEYSYRLMPFAEGLISGLKEIRGVNSAEIV